MLFNGGPTRWMVRNENHLKILPDGPMAGGIVSGGKGQVKYEKRS